MEFDILLGSGYPIHAPFKSCDRSEIGSVFAAIGPLFLTETIAKPDPIPTFIDVGPMAKPPVPVPAEQDKPVDRDWVDEFLGDREIRPNMKKAGSVAKNYGGENDPLLTINLSQ